MTESNPVADSIRHSITKNGFPAKAVRLPFKPVYDSCKKNGVALADVLEQLKGEGIFGQMEGDYILFRSPEHAPRKKERMPDQTTGSEDSAWWQRLSGLGDLSSMAKEAMAKMTPEQLAEVKQRVENMSDEEKKNMMKMMADMFNPSRKKG